MKQCSSQLQTMTLYYYYYYYYYYLLLLLLLLSSFFRDNEAWLFVWNDVLISSEKKNRMPSVTILLSTLRFKEFRNKIIYSPFFEVFWKLSGTVTRRPNRLLHLYTYASIDSHLIRTSCSACKDQIFSATSNYRRTIYHCVESQCNWATTSWVVGWCEGVMYLLSPGASSWYWLIVGQGLLSL